MTKGEGGFTSVVNKTHSRDELICKETAAIKRKASDKHGAEQQTSENDVRTNQKGLPKMNTIMEVSTSYSTTE